MLLAGTPEITSGMTLQSIAIPSGTEGISATLDIMRRLILQGKKDLSVRQTALFLVRFLPQKDWMGEIKAIHAFVRDEIRYVRDVTNVETLHSAPVILKQMQGDCDDKSIILGALLSSIGYDVRIVAVGINGDFSHVYIEVFEPRQKIWIPLETTEPVNVGWNAATLVSRMVREV